MEGDDKCTSTKQVFDVIPGGKESDTFTIVALIILLLLAGATAGTEVTIETVRRVWRQDRLAFVSGMVCQFGFMPILGLLLSLMVSVNDAFCNESSLRLAVLLPACMPGHAVSAILCMWVKGNVHLSILMSLVSNFAAVFVLPLLTLLYYETRFHDAYSIKVPYAELLISLLFNCIGVLIGMAIRKYASSRVTGWVKKIGGIVVTVFIVVGMLSIIRQIVSENDWLNKLPTSFWLTGLTITPLGTFCGLLLAKFVFRLDVRNALTVSIETGIQSTSLQALITMYAFDLETEKRIIADLIINGCLGPMCFFLIHFVWITLLHKMINAKFGAPSKLDPDGMEDVANKNNENQASKIGYTEEGTTVVADIKS